MTLHLYNTLTRTKEPFVPAVEGKVKMYVCGPTVYDYIHIGNARPMIFFDVVHRYLEVAGYEVTFVQNFTDVDDKLIRKSEQTGLSVPEIADRFIQAYYEDADSLGVQRADVHPRVTENMDHIIAFIRELEAKGFAYESGGDVFFRTSRFAEYGKLSGQNTEELQYGIRIEVDERKEHPQDFVLWKQAKPGEIKWDSPWGPGRPGWHIECSAMVERYLGETIDIHGGGHDLQFPHHECEIAQSEAKHGRPLARYWMHNGYIHINNEKMSKSLGNGVLVRELVGRYKPEAVRFFMLSAHYRAPLNFSHEVMVQAEQSIARINNCYVNLKHRLKAVWDHPGDDADVLARIEAIRGKFHEKMQDDFNTPDAITAVFDLVHEANQYLKRDAANEATLQRMLEALQEMNRVLGMIAEETDELLDEEVERLIRERTEARKARNYARADEIRDTLERRGIVLEDTPQGVRWRRK
jgi:cysteinyl-tRNA synthetase